MKEQLVIDICLLVSLLVPADPEIHVHLRHPEPLRIQLVLDVHGDPVLQNEIIYFAKV